MTMGTVTGRSYVPRRLPALAVTFLLSMSDVFLIEAQSAATNEQLDQERQRRGRWRCEEFLKRGGVIVLMEGPGGSNDGTYQNPEGRRAVRCRGATCPSVASR